MTQLRTEPDYSRACSQVASLAGTPAKVKSDANSEYANGANLAELAQNEVALGGQLEPINFSLRESKLNQTLQRLLWNRPAMNAGMCL